MLSHSAQANIDFYKSIREVAQLRNIHLAMNEESYLGLQCKNTHQIVVGVRANYRIDISLSASSPIHFSPAIEIFWRFRDIERPF